jgi:hypothetical protein
MSEVMMKLRQIEHDILATGKVDTPELEVLRQEMHAHRNIERPEADFLVELHKRVQHLTPAFDQPLRSTSWHMAGSTPRRSAGCGGCSSPTVKSMTRSASFCTNSRARLSTSAVSSTCCSRRA